ncbi:MAG TPA: hypothetical protein DCL38_10570, partial [Lachnospiraceae bacterium]|nr:hypothetical protein [Lachnospiraceae bacterium]
MLSYILSKDPEEVFPPYIMSFMLGLYALGILKKSHHAFTASLFFFLLIAVAFSVVLIIRVRPFMQSGRHSAAEIRGFFGRACLKAAGHPGFVFFLTVCVVMCICFSTHFVNVWDDFHYNATFPKDCYYYGTMPVGSELATHYKSYLPLLQLFFYWGFQGSTFSEPMMFQYKIVLIYVLILPLFKRMNDTGGIRRVITGLSALILPFLFLFEILESLSMDTVMGLLFAYAALKITVRRKDDLFGYYEIIVSLLCLTLIKSIAFYFTGVCLALWLCDLLVSEKARDRRELALFGSCVILNAGAFLSWRIFCERNGNTTYLSNRLFSNIKEGSLAIPEYGGQTLSGILKSIFSMPTNLSRFGLSLAGITVIALLTAVWFYMKKVLTRRIMTGIFVCGLGLLGYILILSYTYIFIFDPWEAESLSSLDRYFGTYSLMTGYVLLFMLTLPALDRKADKFVIFGVPVL